jgi:putative alpha-1,2-mannosidase
VYEITSPVFDEVTIKLNPTYYSGKEFKIKTHNNSDANCYIQKATYNNQPFNRVWFSHEDYAKGGTLELWLGNKPEKNFGNN